MAKSKSKLRSSSNTTASSKNNKNMRLRQSSSHSTLSSHSKKSLDNGFSNHVDEDVDDDVNGGDNFADNSTSSMNHHHNINEADEDDDDEFDIRKWTSRHYDNCDDDNSNEAVVRDLYDPKVSNHNTNAKKSYYDDGNCNNGGEGADEDGVFLRYVILLIV